MIYRVKRPNYSSEIPIREAISSLSAVSKAAHSCTLNVLSLLGEFSGKYVNRQSSLIDLHHHGQVDKVL